VAARAGVAETAFHEVFPSIEHCYLEAYQAGIDRLSRTVAEATSREQGWLGRLRAGLVALLGFFDDEPAWARVLVLEAAASTHACRQQLHQVLARLLDQDDATDGPVGSPASLPALTGELVVGGVYSVISTSMLEDGGGKLVELAPSLMAFIAIQYGLPAHAPEVHERSGVSGRPGEMSRAAQLPIRATRRTTLVLRAIAQAPYSNNREVARAAGLNDEGQTSKLLARLERNGVVENVGVGRARGEPNAWLLTASGQRALTLIGTSAAARPRGASVRGAA
jgi:AcrR family transcriptional regulator